MPRGREERVLTGAGADSGLQPLSREWRDLCSNIEDDFEQWLQAQSLEPYGSQL